MHALDENIDVAAQDNYRLAAFNQAIVAHIIEKCTSCRLTCNWTRPTFEFVNGAVSVTQEVAACLCLGTDAENASLLAPFKNSTDGIMGQLRLAMPCTGLMETTSAGLIRDFSVHLFKVVWQVVTRQFNEVVLLQESVATQEEEGLASYTAYRLRQTLRAHCNLLRIGRSYAQTDARLDFELAVDMIEGALHDHM